MRESIGVSVWRCVIVLHPASEPVQKRTWTQALKQYRARGNYLLPTPLLHSIPSAQVMGRLRRSRTHGASREVHRASRTRVRLFASHVPYAIMRPVIHRRALRIWTKFSSLILIRKYACRRLIQNGDRQRTCNSVQNRAKLEAQPLDYEKPGLAQHYCVECAKYVSTHGF